jgi:hypothetical protein
LPTYTLYSIILPTPHLNCLTDIHHCFLAYRYPIAFPTCTGCAVTSCSAVSPACCQMSADRRGGDSLPEEVGGRAGTGIC